MEKAPEKPIPVREIPSLTQDTREILRQYQDALPTIHLTLVSVLQGIAFTVLLLGIPLPGDPSQPPVPIFEFLLKNYFYLPYLVSSLLVIVVWKLSVYANIFSFWPFSTLRVLLIYLTALVEIIAFREIATLSIWIIALGSLAVIHGSGRFNNLRFLREDNFELRFFSQKTITAYRKQQFRNGITYTILGITTVIFGLLIDIIKSSIPQFAIIITWGVLVLLFGVMCIMLFLCRTAHLSFLRLLTKGSDLVVTADSVISYKKVDGREKPGGEPHSTIQLPT
jgi:hypothetical protein